MPDFKWILERDDAFRYRLLSRLQSDCMYFLGNGNRNTRHLWAASVEEQIEAIKILWNSFNEESKPEWLTWGQIENFERDMMLHILVPE